jgi:hypothetical protein
MYSLTDLWIVGQTKRWPAKPAINPGSKPVGQAEQTVEQKAVWTESLQTVGKQFD